MSLEQFNYYLNKMSKGRYDIKTTKNGIYYIYDYDYREKVSSYNEIKDILECMFLFNNELKDNKDILNFINIFRK